MRVTPTNNGRRNHKHDCDSCQFIRSTVFDDGRPETTQVDWYVHKDRKDVRESMVVGRHGSGPSQTWSWRIRDLARPPGDHAVREQIATSVALEYLLKHHWPFKDLW